jgi:PhzF family phenazine biosynthesis protein
MPGRIEMGLTIYQVDAFTREPFRGNPAGVCVLPEPRDEAWMRNVAREMNLSETAFLVKEEDGFHLRWFTPAVEVEMCGHATLASAHILWETGILSSGEQARFHTLSGLLTAERLEEMIELNFPATPDRPVEAPPELGKALGVTPRYVGKSIFDYLVELDSEEAVRTLNPDFGLLKMVPIRGVMVTASSATPGFDFVSRFFAPAAGVDEDPVTGSAHCCLGPFWGRRLNRTEFTAYQVSARGGVVHVRLDGDRVRIGGDAVTVFAAELRA